MDIKRISISAFVIFGLFAAAVFAQTPETVGLENAVINVAGTTGKAVVSISTEHTEKAQGAGQRRMYFNQPGGVPFGGGGQNDETFRRFFDDFFGGMPDREFKQTGLGSGVIINSEGYILTNEHVVNNADKITVTLPDGRQFKGEVKGKDVRSDLAVVKISAHELPVATLGDSDSIKIGQWVVAIGNPFAFALTNPEPTVTSGVISALHRTLGMIAQDKDYNDLIQTDASINPGNSGGPLTNLKGEVVGINVAIFSTSGGSQGIGFAIPINNAKRIMTRLIEGKKIAYGWLGITVQNLNEDLSGYFGLPNKNGVLVAKIIEGGPAQKGGMKERDVIKQLDGKPINSVRELLSVVAGTEVGRKLKVLVARDKKDITLDIAVGERPESTGNIEETGGAAGVETSKWRGLEVDTQGAKGVVVIKIEPGSAADNAGIIQGDRVLEINKQAITNAADYQKATQGSKGDALIRTGRGYFIIKG
jgi:serine protease Do